MAGENADTASKWGISDADKDTLSFDAFSKRGIRQRLFEAY
jgi:hypothetical protein